MFKFKTFLFFLLVVAPSLKADQFKTRREQVQEILNLLPNGNKLIIPNPNSTYDDIILVLEANQTDGATTSLPTLGLQPYLSTHSKTGLLFYNFDGNKSATEEITQAFHTKQSLDQALRLKILLLFNYTQMIRENQTEFTKFLDKASNFIRRWDKYRPGVAIVGTGCKALGPRASLHAVHRIGRVLHDLKRNASSSRLTLIEILLARDTEGSYTRIGHMNNPWDEAQPSNSFFEVVQSTKYILKSGQDFQFPLSQDAKLLLDPLSEKCGGKVGTVAARLGTQIQAYYQQPRPIQGNNGTTISLASEIGKLIKDYKILKNMILDLERVRTRRNFTLILHTVLTSQLKLPIDLKILKEMQTQFSYLDFIDFLSSKAPTLTHSEWTRPLTHTTDTIFFKVNRLSESLNAQMETTLLSVGRELRKVFQLKLVPTERVTITPAEDRRIYEDLNRDYERLNDLVIFLPTAPSFNEFNTRVWTVIERLSVRNENLPFMSDSTFSSIPEDFSLSSLHGRVLSFNLQAWIRPMDQLLLFLRVERNQLEFKLRDSDHRDVMQEIRRSMQEKCERTIAAVREEEAAKCPVCL